MPGGRDPVCGMNVDERTAAGTSVYEGARYFFCSAGCKRRFDASPESFVKPPAAKDDGAARDDRPAEAPAAGEWTCPMHPEVVRPAPGACPICGMALEPRTVSDHED